MKSISKTKKLNFDDQLSLLVFGCHASAPFNVKDVKESVFDFNRGTISSVSARTITKLPNTLKTS